MIPPLFGKQEVGIWRVKKRFPQYGVPIWSLWPNIRSIIPPLPEGGGGYTVLPLSVCPSVQDIFRLIFLSNCWWQKYDIWSQASYRYTILWVAFLDPPDSYFLFADLVGFYTYWTYMHIFRHIFLSNYSIDGRNLIFGHKLHIGTPYRGKRFLTRQIPTSCLPKSGGIIAIGEH
jgi:hypothetical protein